MRYEADLAEGQHYIIYGANLTVAENGFLRVPLALRKATSEDYCG